MHLRCLASIIIVGGLAIQPNPAIAANSEEACQRLEQALVDHEALSLEQSPSLVEIPPLPTFCQVRGKAAEHIGFEMRLPLANEWNQKFVMAGCGGFCGQVLPDKPGYSNSINESLKQGYAVLAHDSGHQTASNADTRWARQGNGDALELWAHRALPELMGVAEQVLSTYYEETPTRRYFSGCSNGGRLGLIAAQRYPHLFDAIAAGGPILDLSGNAGVQGAWMIQHIQTNHGKSLLDPQQLEGLIQHVRQQCDALDGVSDGVVADPDRCLLDLSPLACSHAPTAHCLADEQLQSIRALYRGAHEGERSLFPGLPPGSEHLWPIWVTGRDGQPSWGQLAGQGFLDIYRQAPVDQSANALEVDVVAEAQAMAGSPVAMMANATDPDLSEFINAGGKLLIWHGWADPLILPQRTVAYFDEAQATHDGAQAFTDHVRLFMVPGHGHCWEAPGLAPDLFDPVAAIDTWMDGDETISHIIARDQIDPDMTEATALLCPHPLRARHHQGPIDQAASYRCELLE